jgi:hypothetical protein
MVDRFRHCSPGHRQHAAGKQDSVEQQYLFALLNHTPRNKYLWEAVPHFFPPNESNKNRVYAGKAWLQSARQLMKQDDKEKNEAEKLLRQIILIPEMDALVKALARLELAVIARDHGDEALVNEHISQATLLHNKLSDLDDSIFLQNIPPTFAEMFSSDRARESDL